MFTYRFFSVSVILILMAVIASTMLGVFPHKPSNPIYTESKENVLREYQLGERYGVIPDNSIAFNPEQIRREYFLGERYGETPAEYSFQRALREYWLGERYGQIP